LKTLSRQVAQEGGGEGMSSAMVWWSDPQFDTKGCDSVAGRGAGPKKSPALFFLAVILKVEQNQVGQKYVE